MITQLVVVLNLAQALPLARKESITVSAEAGKRESLDAVPQRVNVIGIEQLRERAGSGMAEAFREEVGLEVQRTSSFMGGIIIRGFTGNKVVVYRDGVRYSNSSGRGGVSTFFNLLDSGGIEQAEVLRGPTAHSTGAIRLVEFCMSSLAARKSRVHRSNGLLSTRARRMLLAMY